VALGLGANAGDARAAIDRAVVRLNGVLRNARRAPLYRTRALGPAQADFINTALTGETDLTPRDLLAVTKALELAAGRRPGPRNHPRPLDIDLLLYDDCTNDEPELRLPHPRLRERRFALAPLADLAPDWPVPPGGETVGELLRALGDRQRVERLP
jgi:2-amino-4-hydroxy-6-hydroxymethyldihydropteridine diphosphokinase